MIQWSNYTKEFNYNLKLAYPIMLGQLGHMVVALVDNIMVGKLGPTPLAAVSLGNALIYIALSLGIGFSFVITPLVAEAHGASNESKARAIFHNGVFLNLLNGVFLVLVLFLARPILHYMDQPPEVVAMAIPYMEIVAISLIPLMLYQAFKQFADGMSETKYAMYATIVSNVLNVVFNYVLIYGWWIFPALEIEGAALGTLLSRIILCGLLGLILFKLPKFSFFFTLSQKPIINRDIIKKILNQGLPTALQMLFEVGLFTSAIFLAGKLGVLSQAANQIALNLASITFMLAVGLSVTATIRVGNQKGLKNWKKLRRVAFSLVLLVFLIESVFAIGFFLLKDVLPWIYIDDVAVVDLAAGLLLIAGLFQLSDGIQVVVLGSLRGLQDVWVPTIICFIAYWLVGFPISYYLGNKELLGVSGIWYGLLTGLSVSALLLYLRFNFLTKSQK